MAGLMQGTTAHVDRGFRGRAHGQARHPGLRTRPCRSGGVTATSTPSPVQEVARRTPLHVVVNRGAEIVRVLGSWWAQNRLEALTSGCVSWSLSASAWAGRRQLPPHLPAPPSPASDLERSAASRLRAALLSLGAAYIKLGQALASRPDVLSPIYIDELSELQDNVPPFGNLEAIAILESELKRPASEIFSALSAEPVAAASLGQVYRATLRVSGESVAVKVQRPGVRDVIALDFYLLRVLAAVIRARARVNTDLVALVDEYASSLFLECDYRQEVANGDRFRALFGGRGGVFVPKMMPALSTERVLVMEWVDGERLTDTNVSDIGLVSIGVQCSLEQLFEAGFYHADPHPGNLFRTTRGELAYIDFGMTGTLPRGVQTGLIKAAAHLVNREYALLADDMIALGFLPKDSSPEQRARIVPALVSVFSGAVASGVRNLSFSNLSSDLGKTMYQFGFRLPSYYFLVVRSLAVLEGIALKVDPKYKVLGAAYPWIARKLLTDPDPQLQGTLRQLLYTSTGRFNVARLSALLQQSEGSFAGAPSGGDSRLVAALRLLLVAEGSAVRDVIVDELVKGIDAASRVALDAARSAALAAAGTLAPAAAAAIPAIADQGDHDRVEDITQLMALAFPRDGDSSATGPLLGSAAAVMTRGRSILTALQNLPPSAKQQAAAQAWRVAQDVALRGVARAIRSTLSPKQDAGIARAER